MLNAKAFRQTRRTEALAGMISFLIKHCPNRIARDEFVISNARGHPELMGRQIVT
jgi:hypothetical protein